ncbi:probable purine-binding chemotaxis protein [Oceanospirillum sp. MED92]|uniref:Probable purine-binding chemotaxis protein n=2 Tax=Neptuniibacter caesariensis TaxID=207954 RepID=A0A7U8C4B4_NEPCE|nr:probable purine-binding chemotaxis protein [Oceanospirillum sp. MED92] [Neptuniibacter caesariensis]
MGLEAAAEQLKAMQAEQVMHQQADDAKRSNQDEVVYHQWATFKVDNELYGVDVIQVKEVLRYSEITPVPGSDYFILGIINLRGNVVTVIDTRQMFGLSPHTPDDDTRIIVVEYNEQEVVGLVVDSVDEVINLPQNDIDRAPNATGEETTKRFVQGVCYYNSILIILLDLLKMLQSITPMDTGEDF